LKQQVAYTETSLSSYRQCKQSLYDSYAGMLLGYILEVVKNHSIAEQYLVGLFQSLQFKDVQDIMQPGINTYCRLQQLARKKLNEADNNDGTIATSDSAPNQNIYTQLMTPDQQLVFCGVHYHGKTTAMLAIELNKPEAQIRQLLKESFTIIRSNP
jgi:hypothetical protein